MSRCRLRTIREPRRSRPPGFPACPPGSPDGTLQLHGTDDEQEAAATRAAQLAPDAPASSARSTAKSTWAFEMPEASCRLVGEARGRFSGALRPCLWALGAAALATRERAGVTTLLAASLGTRS